ncbi:MAG: membrane protein insertion efficiency factor YidD [Acidobacteria bacterium]|nr:membrane protein insertion efficiency factor YidD [Acidobacteriota bacterium]
MRELLMAALRLYKRWISPCLPSACRFYPTCSEYTLEAVHRYGAARGLWLGLKRLGKCHPFHEGGCDPVH